MKKSTTILGVLCALAVVLAFTGCPNNAGSGDNGGGGGEGIVAGTWQKHGNAGFSQGNSTASEAVLAFDSANVAYVAFKDIMGAGYRTKVVNLVNGTWTDVGDTYGSAVKAISLTVDGTTPYLGHYDGSGQLGTKYVHLDKYDSAWTQIKMNASALMQESQVAVVGTTPYILYRFYPDAGTQGPGTLKGASLNGTTLSADNGMTSAEKVESLGLEAVGDELYAGYVEVPASGSKRIVVRKRTGTTWGEPIAPINGSSLVLAKGNGTIFIAYIDETSKVVVKKLNAAGNGWDSVGSKVFDYKDSLFLAADASGTPYVAFRTTADTISVYKNVASSSTGWSAVGSLTAHEDAIRLWAIETDSAGVPYILINDNSSNPTNTNSNSKWLSVLKFIAQ